MCCKTNGSLNFSVTGELVYKYCQNQYTQLSYIYIYQFGQELTSLWLQLNQAVPNVARGHCVITDFRVWMQTKYIRLIDQRQFVNVGCYQCILHM